MGICIHIFIFIISMWFTGWHKKHSATSSVSCLTHLQLLAKDKKKNKFRWEGTLGKGFMRDRWEKGRSTVGEIKVVKEFCDGVGVEVTGKMILVLSMKAGGA